MRAGWRERRSEARDEGDLVRGMLAGEESAFDVFADDYIPALYRFAQRRLGDRELTRDIVQETLCKVIGKLPTFRGEAGLATWLCACCRNEIAARYRRQGRSPAEAALTDEQVMKDGPLGSGVPDGPEESLLRKERSRLVHTALDALPPHYGKALEWKYVDRLSVKQIAARLELRPKAAESLLTRARESFRDGYRQLAASARPALATAEAADPAKGTRA